MLRKIILLCSLFWLPIFAMEMEKPEIIKIKDFGVAHRQGRRDTMEDKHSTDSSVLGSKVRWIFGIYDGHGGAKIADYVSRKLPKILEEKLDRLDPVKALKYTFEMIDANLKKSSLKEAAKTQGTTAIVVLKIGTEVYAANVGDSRAVLSRNGKAIALSKDHKPNRADEKERIEEIGGKVEKIVVWRVEGNLAISRSIGDHALNPYVIARPEIKKITLTEDDEFIILACDGIFDVMSNQEAADIVRKSLNINSADSKAEEIAAINLVNTAYCKGSRDNLSAIVVTLKRSKLDELVMRRILKKEY